MGKEDSFREGACTRMRLEKPYMGLWGRCCFCGFEGSMLDDWDGVGSQEEEARNSMDKGRAVGREDNLCLLREDICCLDVVKIPLIE